MAQDARSVEGQLRRDYVGSERMLRHFYIADTLKFDADGNALNKEKTGSWTLFGAVRIDKLTLSSGKLDLQGHRAIVAIDDAAKTMKRIPWSEKVRIEIPVHEGPDAASQVRSALAEVFVVPGEDMVATLPDYWQDYMVAFFAKHGKPCQDSQSADASESHSETADGAEANQTNPPMKVSAGVMEGRLIHRAEPQYFLVARQAGVQGEIGLRARISKSGDVIGLCLTQAIGGGMDDEAVNTVRQWKYSPYLLNGTALEIKTSISFRFRMR
jgi:TonB family protein